jgi:hypothetical protein
MRRRYGNNIFPNEKFYYIRRNHKTNPIPGDEPVQKS